MEAKKIIARLRQETEKYFKIHHKKIAIFGKSKGIDSSVIAGLLSEMKSIKPIAAVIPVDSEKDDELIAKKVLEFYKIPYVKINLSGDYKKLANNLYLNNNLKNQVRKIARKSNQKQILQLIKQRKYLALGNIKARLRMITLYHLAQVTDGIVIGTSNFSEYMTGFWTLHGDVGDFYPLISFYKTEVYQLGKALKVPNQSLKAVPSDGLNITKKGTDEEQLGLPYHKIDKIIFNYIKTKNINKICKKTKIKKSDVENIVNRIKNSQFKRKAPLGINKWYQDKI
jgi:NAD+ synthase